MSSLYRSAATSNNATTSDLSKDATLSMPPEDSISSLSWSPAANFLAVGSWDNKVRIYDITNSQTGTGVAAIDFEGPVLSCDWSKVHLSFSQLQIRFLANFYSGRHKSRRSRRRPLSQTPRSKRQRSTRADSICTRCAHPLYPLLREPSCECAYASNRLLGQVGQILGFEAADTGSDTGVPGQSIFYGCERPVACYWDGGETCAYCGSQCSDYNI